MSVTSRSRRIRPVSALALFLGRPGLLWASFTTSSAGAPEGRW